MECGGGSSPGPQKLGKPGEKGKGSRFALSLLPLPQDMHGHSGGVLACSSPLGKGGPAGTSRVPRGAGHLLGSPLKLCLTETLGNQLELGEGWGSRW